MQRKRFSVLFYLLFLFSIPLFSPSPIQAEETLWVGEKKMILLISQETGIPLLRIPAEHLEDIAVDRHRGVVWAGTRKEIIQYAFGGQAVFRYSLRMGAHSSNEQKNENEADGGRAVHLSLDLSTGAVWIGEKEEAIKLSFEGRELLRIRVGSVKDLSVDLSDGAVWVGLKDRIIKYSSEGARLFSLDLEQGNKVKALAAEPHSHSLWVGTKKGMVKVSKEGFTRLKITELSDIQDLKVDYRDDSIWGVTKKKIFRYSDEGKRGFVLAPCLDRDDDSNKEEGDRQDHREVGGNHKGNGGKKDDDEETAEETAEDHESPEAPCKGNWVTLAIDPSDGSGWAALRKMLLQSEKSGVPLLSFAGFKQIKAVDIGLPKIGIEITEPPEGVIVEIPTVTVEGRVTDPTARVSVNGLEATVTGLTFKVEGVPLHVGANLLTATAINLARLTAEDRVEITYRPPLPPLTIKIDAPTDGAAVSTSRIRVTGRVSDPRARVLVHGIEAVVSGNTFSASDVPLAIGENQITALATDSTGRIAADSVTVTVAWIDLSIVLPRSGDLFTAQPMEVKGIVSDPKAFVEVNGVAATVSPDGAFRASGVPLAEGLNPIVARAASLVGLSDSDTVYVTYQPSSVPLEIVLLTPKEGAILDTSTFLVRGRVNDPTATVLVRVDGNDTVAAVDEGFFEATVFTCALPGPLPSQTGSEPDVCTITVTAYSQNGQTAAQTLTYTHIPSEAPLTVTITDPSPKKRFTFSPVEIKGTINDVLSGFSPTVVTVNGVRAIVQLGAFSALVPLQDGINDITVHAENLVGTDAYHTIRIIYEPLDKPLSVLVTSPVAPFIVNHAPITVSGDVNDSGASVDVNGIPAEQDFRSFKVSVPLSIGLNTLAVTATRPNGERVTSTLQVTYDPNAPSPPPPTLSPLSPYARTSFIDLSGLTDPLFHLDLIVNGVIQSRVQADAEGRFTATAFLGPDEGPYHLSARAVDPSGNTGRPSDEILVIKDTRLPIVWAPFSNNISLVPFGFPVARAQTRFLHRAFRRC